MAGLNLQLGAGAQVRSGAPQPGTASYPAPRSIGEAAFGPGYTAAGVPSTGAMLAPNDPFGVALWTGVLAIGLLLFIRYSLPA